MTVMLGFTLASFNLDRIRSFRAKHALDEQGRPTEKPKKTRARRRTGDVVRRDRADGPAAPVAKPNRGFGRSPMAAGFGAPTDQSGGENCPFIVRSALQRRHQV